MIKNKLEITEDKLNKEINNIDKKKLNNELIKVKKDLDKKSFNIKKIKD